MHSGRPVELRALFGHLMSHLGKSARDPLDSARDFEISLEVVDEAIDLASIYDYEQSYI